MSREAWVLAWAPRYLRAHADTLRGLALAAYYPDYQEAIRAYIGAARASADVKSCRIVRVLVEGYGEGAVLRYWRIRLKRGAPPVWAGRYIDLAEAGEDQPHPNAAMALDRAARWGLNPGVVEAVDAEWALKRGAPPWHAG